MAKIVRVATSVRGRGDRHIAHALVRRKTESHQGPLRAVGIRELLTAYWLVVVLVAVLAGISRRFATRTPRPTECRARLAHLQGGGGNSVIPDQRLLFEACGSSPWTRDRRQILPYAPRAESLALQRDSEALLLLIPEAGGRGKGVLSGKVFEYVAVGRPILASVPPDGAAAELIRETGAGVIAPPDDPVAIRTAIEELHGRWRDDGLPDVDLSDDWRDRLSRRTRVEEMAAVLRATLA